MSKLTHGQRNALIWLKAMQATFPQNDFGFNPTYRAKEASICRHSLEALGLVRINRVSERHFRYAITEAGRAALSHEEKRG